MKVARLYAAGDIRVEEAPEPDAREDYTRVRIGAVGLCGSDLHWFAEGGIGDARLDRPLIPGHEMGGVAIDGPYQGQVVAVDPAIPCERCERCMEGNPNLCEKILFSGHSVTDGGMTEVMSWPTRRLVPVPEGMTSAEAAVLEPLGVAIHAWDLASMKLAMRVAIVGAGPIGLLLTQMAARLGTSHVTVVEPMEHRREAASRMGADEVLSPADVTPGMDTHDVVFEVDGNPESVESAMVLARAGGRVCLVGIPNEDTTTFTASTARRKGLTLMAVRRMKEVYHRAITLVERGIIDLDSVISDTYDMDDVEAAFKRGVSREGLKVIVRPTRA